MVFILISFKFHVHITIFDDKKKQPLVKQYDSDRFYKKKNPKLMVNHVELVDNSGGVIKEYSQYFFVNLLN